MDLSREVTYRGYTLNMGQRERQDNTGGSASTDNGWIEGCVMNSCDMSDVDIIQFMEKRSLQDGMDAGDPYLGARRIRMAGTLYGQSRAQLYDKYLDLRAIFSATLASRESPADKGFLPLYFSMPTTQRSPGMFDGAEDGETIGVRSLRVLAIPHAFQAVFQDKQQGWGDLGLTHDEASFEEPGDDPIDPLALPWQATLVMKDPCLQGAAPKTYSLAASTLKSGTAAATGDLITSAAHGLSIGDPIYFTVLTGGTGLTVGTRYYVIASGFTTGAFKVSTTLGGAAVNITVNYSAVQFTGTVTGSAVLVSRGNYHAPFNMLIEVGPQAGTILVTVAGTILTLTIPASTGDRILRYKGQDKVLTVEENDIEEVNQGILTSSSDFTFPLIPGASNATTSESTELDVAYAGVTVLAGSRVWFYETYA